MRSRRLQFVLVLVAFTLAWFCIRLPYETRGLVESFLGGASRVDPLTLHLQGEFVESNLGAAEEPDGAVTVRVIAQQYNFVPQCVQVPTHNPVRIRITSADGVHRFSISGIDREVEAVPGHVSESQVQFPTAGDYAVPCHEFCGAGHYAMRSRIVAVEQFPRLKPDERLTCASP